MRNPTGVSRRVASCLQGLKDKDHEFALVNLFPAVDKTAKKRRPSAKVGERIRAFISDDELLISYVATWIALKNICVDGITFPEALYKFGRTSIAHEGELDCRLTFNDSGNLQIGSTWNLPSSYIFGLCIATVIAPENLHEYIPISIQVHVLGQPFELNSLWGNRVLIQTNISKAFQLPSMFDPAT